MNNIVWIIGALIALWGVIIVFMPGWMKTLICVFSKKGWIYLIAAVKIMAGIVFLIFARTCRLPWGIILIGLLAAGGNILFCLLPYAKMRTFFDWVQSRPLWLFRIWGVLAAALGGLIMYAGVPTS